MQNTVGNMTRAFLAVIALTCLTALPATAQDCTEWEDKPFWEKVTPEQVQICLDNGARLYSTPSQAITPLHSAVKYSNNPKVIIALLDAGADVNARAPNGRTVYATPLHLAAQHSKTPKVVKILLDAGAEVDALLGTGDWNGTVLRTPLHQAAKHNENAEIITLLLQAGADVNLNENPTFAGLSALNIELSTRIYASGRTAVYFAAKYNKNPKIITALINAGADINTRDSKFKRTPLHLAALWNENPEVVMVLLNAGADGKIKDRDGITAFRIARKNRAVKKSPAYQALKDASK